MKKSDCIIILTPGFAASEADTTCVPLIQGFVRVAAAQYPDIRFVVVAFQYPFTKGSYQWHNAEVHAIGGRNRPQFGRLITWIKAYNMIKQVTRQYNCLGLLSLWLSETALVGKRFARSHQLPHFTWLHGQDVRKSNRYTRLVNPKAGSLIGLSDFTRTEMQKNHGVRPFTVIPNGIDGSEFPPLNTQQRDIDVLGAGSLIPLKNYASFVRVVHAVKQHHPGVQAVIAGEGPEHRDLEALVQQLGLVHNIRLVGSVPHPEVLALMNRSKVFLHTSKFEGLGKVLLESLYSGCRVVSTIALSSVQLKNMTVCTEETAMAVEIKRLLHEQAAAERVRFYDMKDTVERIVGLYV